MDTIFEQTTGRAARTRSRPWRPPLVATLGLGLLTAAPLAVLNSAPASAAGPLTFTASSSAVAEGDFGHTGGGTITLHLSAPAQYPVHINYRDNRNLGNSDSTYASTATYGVEWSLDSGTVTFNAGEQTKYLNVPIIGDSTPEADEYAAVSFFSSEATVATPISYVEILDDDAPHIRLTGVSQLEGSSDGYTRFSIRADLDKASTQPVSFSISQCCGTAQTDDLAPVSGTVTIPPGQTVWSFPVWVRADTVREAPEDFYVSGDGLSNANPYHSGSGASWDRTLWSHNVILNDD